MAVYYNEFNPYAAEWLRNLIKEGHIAPGYVDERSIVDVKPNELLGYSQCHFFAGIGVWSYALRQAGWPDDKPVWTASCPCQPFSSAGKGAGFNDERHLWPYLQWLIQQRRPAATFGEQVASKDAAPWINLVQADLEAMGYRFAGIPFPASSVGAPHIRDRLFWVADTGISGLNKKRKSIAKTGSNGTIRNGTTERMADPHSKQHNRSRPRGEAGRIKYPDSGAIIQLANTDNQGSQGRGRVPKRSPELITGSAGMADRLADPNRYGRSPEVGSVEGEAQIEQIGDWPHEPGAGLSVRASPALLQRFAGAVNGFWSAADWIYCRDGKWRPVEPGSSPLVDGSAGGMGRVRSDQAQLTAQIPRKDQGSRVGRLQGYGNAINAYAAIEFISSYLETNP